MHVEGNVAHALFYAPTELRKQLEERLHSVPDEQEPIFGYAERTTILAGIRGICHTGFVTTNSDALVYWDRVIDRIKGEERS